MLPFFFLIEIYYYDLRGKTKLQCLTLEKRKYVLYCNSYNELTPLGESFNGDFELGLGQVTCWTARVLIPRAD